MGYIVFWCNIVYFRSWLFGSIFFGDRLEFLVVIFGREIFNLVFLRFICLGFGLWLIVVFIFFRG